jgi:hypothetical protein
MELHHVSGRQSYTIKFQFFIRVICNQIALAMKNSFSPRHIFRDKLKSLPLIKFREFCLFLKSHRWDEQLGAKSATLDSFVT